MMARWASDSIPMRKGFPFIEHINFESWNKPLSRSCLSSWIQFSSVATRGNPWIGEYSALSTIGLIRLPRSMTG
jgi:hypothetical protein